jgi:hypothetical protein
MAKSRDNRTREDKKKKRVAKKPAVTKEQREVLVRKPEAPPS